MKLHTKKGKLTSYALHCGYVQTFNGYVLQVEHSQYVVKGFCIDNKYFSLLSEARKYINSL